MSRISIFLDESGDLGWNFDHPYRKGGSSRHLTIGSLIVDPNAKDKPKRLIKKLYKKFNWNHSREIKWADMSHIQRSTFANYAFKLIEDYPSILRYRTIYVRKEFVQPHIRNDPNKLYNYMIARSLLVVMKEHDEVLLHPDPRSIKVASGNSLHDYLQTQLWFKYNVKTKLTTEPLESSSSKNIQFADMLCGLVQSHIEDSKSDYWNILQNKIYSQRLF